MACWSLSVLRRSQRRASKTFFGPRCLCQNFALLCAVSSVPGASVKILLSCARGLLVLVRLEEKSTARQQNVFRSPMPLSNFRDHRRRPGPGACGGEVSSAPAKFCSVSANRDAPIFCGKRSAHPKKFSTILDHHDRPGVETWILDHG